MVGSHLERQAQGKDAPLALDAGDGDRPPVLFDDLLGAGQSDTGAVYAARNVAARNVPLVGTVLNKYESLAAKRYQRYGRR